MNEGVKMDKKITNNEIAYYINNVKEAYILFNIEGDDLTVTKTYVGDALRGKGMARMLMDDVMNYAKNKYNVKATCSYAIKYLGNLENEKN